MPSSPSITLIILSACFSGSVAAFVIAAVAKARKSRTAPPPAPAAGDAAAPEPAGQELSADGAIFPYGPPQAPQPPVSPSPPPGKVAVWPYRWFDLAWMGFIVFLFALLSLSNAIHTENRGEVTITANGLVESIGFQLVVAGVTVFLVAWRIRPIEWLGLRWAGWRWALLIGPAAVLGMWFFSAGIYLAGYLKWMEALGVESTQESVKLLQKTTDPLVLGLMALAAVVVAPLCEEVVFRGYLYPAAKRFAGPWVAGAASALVFAAAHGSLAPLLPLFVFGALLVLAYELTGSLWAPIAMHFCFNGATVAIQMAVRLSGIELPTP